MPQEKRSSIQAILRLKKVPFATKLEGEWRTLSGHATKKNVFSAFLIYLKGMYTVKCIPHILYVEYPNVNINQNIQHITNDLLKRFSLTFQKIIGTEHGVSPMGPSGKKTGGLFDLQKSYKLIIYVFLCINYINSDVIITDSHM